MAAVTSLPLADTAAGRLLASHVLLLGPAAADLLYCARGRLEPAGSHGVWGLDDYQFLPFLWGASQLIAHPTLQPPSIHDDKLLSQHAPDYLYLAAVHFVRQVRGPLWQGKCARCKLWQRWRPILLSLDSNQAATFLTTELCLPCNRSSDVAVGHKLIELCFGCT